MARFKRAFHDDINDLAHLVMIANFHCIAAESDAGERLDRFIRRNAEGVDLTGLREAIADGHVLLNSRRAAKGAKLRAGDVVDARDLPEPSDRRIKPDATAPLEVVREEALWVACAKPAAMPTHPLRPDETGTLANAMVAHWPEIADFGDPPLMGGILHRLDTDTSGIVLAARTPEAYTNLRAQFAAREVVKTYLALVSGKVEKPGLLRDELVHATVHPCRMGDASRVRTDERPMRAETAYRPLSRHGEYTLLEVTIRTGVTHQIRCQLSLAGLPLVGDALYGGPRVGGLSRHFLHASAIAFRDPATGRPVEVRIPLSPELADFIA